LAAAMHRFAREHRMAWVDFREGPAQGRRRARAPRRVHRRRRRAVIGRPQEKTRLFRTERHRDAASEAYTWIVKTTAVVNRFYVYAVDADFGPFSLKFCSYFPYNAPVQDLEPDVVGIIFSAPGAGGGDTETAR
jgi:hypothetical protein